MKKSISSVFFVGQRGHSFSPSSTLKLKERWNIELRMQ